MTTNNSNVRFPNELGRAYVSVKSMRIVPIDSVNYGDVMAENNRRKPKKDRKSTQNAEKKAIDDIWRHMGLGHIDISYACVGYSMDGRPILNHDDFANLLASYGFDISAVVQFIDDFAASSTTDSKSPIVMFTTNTSAIMTDIKPLDN